MCKANDTSHLVCDEAPDVIERIIRCVEILVMLVLLVRALRAAMTSQLDSFISLLYDASLHFYLA